MKDSQILPVLFNLVFRFFLNMQEYVPTKNCFGTLFHSCMFDIASKGGGGGGVRQDWVLTIMLWSSQIHFTRTLVEQIIKTSSGGQDLWMSYHLCQKFKQKCFPTQVPLQANGKAPSLPANQSTLCLLTQNTPLTNHNAGFSKWATTCNIEICCVTSWERSCNTGNNPFQLAMQQCCATSRAKMLPVLLDLNWNQYKI